MYHYVSKFKLLVIFNFVNNISIVCNDRLRKILPFFNKLQRKYQQIFTSREHILIDETLIPWHRRFIFKQYISNKAHKYRIKLFKLYLSEGFT